MQTTKCKREINRASRKVTVPAVQVMFRATVSSVELESIAQKLDWDLHQSDDLSEIEHAG